MKSIDHRSLTRDGTDNGILGRTNFFRRLVRTCRPNCVYSRSATSDERDTVPKGDLKGVCVSVRRCIDEVNALLEVAEAVAGRM